MQGHQESISEPISKPASTRGTGGIRWVAFGLGIGGVVWLGGAVVAFSNAEVGLLAFFGLLLAGALLGAVWLVGVLLDVWVWLRSGGRLGPRLVLRWAGVPVCGLLGVWLLWTDLDFVLRLKLSEPALVARCRSLLDDPDAHAIDGEWVGLFRVHRADPGGDGLVRLVTVLPGVFDEGGVYYDPAGVIRATDEWPEERARVFGPWARFSWSD